MAKEPVDDICKELAAIFGNPCNFSPIDEFMLENGNCEDICCGDDMTDALCWKRYFETKLNQ